MRKISEKNKSVCSKHKRHRIGGDFQITNMTFEELEKFNEQMSAAAQSALETSGNQCPSCAKLEAEQQQHETSTNEPLNELHVKE